MASILFTFFQEVPTLRICSGFLPSVLCVHWLLPDVYFLFPSAPELAYLYLQVHHEERLYRCCCPLLIKNRRFSLSCASDRFHSYPLSRVPCCFRMKPFSVSIHSCRNMQTSKSCCQSDFSHTVCFLFCDRCILRIIQHLKRKPQLPLRYSLRILY